MSKIIFVILITLSSGTEEMSAEPAPETREQCEKQLETNWRYIAQRPGFQSAECIARTVAQ